MPSGTLESARVPINLKPHNRFRRSTSIVAMLLLQESCNRRYLNLHHAHVESPVWCASTPREEQRNRRQNARKARILPHVTSSVHWIYSCGVFPLGRSS